MTDDNTLNEIATITAGMAGTAAAIFKAGFEYGTYQGYALGIERAIECQQDKAVDVLRGLTNGFADALRDAQTDAGGAAPTS